MDVSRPSSPWALTPKPHLAKPPSGAATPFSVMLLTPEASPAAEPLFISGRTRTLWYMAGYSPASAADKVTEPRGPGRWAKYTELLSWPLAPRTEPFGLLKGHTTP